MYKKTSKNIKAQKEYMYENEFFSQMKEIT